MQGAFLKRMTSGFSRKPPSTVPSGSDLGISRMLLTSVPTGWQQKQSIVTLNLPNENTPATWLLVKIV